MSTVSRLVPAPPPACLCCRSRRASVTVLDHGDVDVLRIHERACRTRWDLVAKRRDERRIWDWLGDQRVFVADYNAPPARHRYVQRAA